MMRNKKYEVVNMNKAEMIVELRKINPLRSISSFNLADSKEIKTLYGEALRLGIFKQEVLYDED